MHLLVTRPERQGQRTTEVLRSRGHRVTHVPMLRIVANSDTDLGSGPYAAVAVTSANAVDAIAEHPRKNALLKLPVFAVGERTAEAARSAGFTDVVFADGDVTRLAEVVMAMVPRGGLMLYLAGTDRTGDFAGTLEAVGYPVRLVEVYRAVAADVLPEDVLRALRLDSVHGVLHYSRRSAETFLRLAAAGSCLVNVLKCKHFCLSAQVAEPLVAAGAGEVHVAQRPEELALLELVGNI